MNFIKLKNSKNENLNKKLFSFTTEKLPNTIFSILGYEFYKNIYLKNNFKKIYYYKKKKKILILVSYIDKKLESNLKIEIIKYFIFHPKKLILLFKNIYFFFKIIKYPKNYIQLFHFIVDKSSQIKINKKVRDKKIHQLHKKLINNKYLGIFAIFNNENLSAKNYYKKNKFIIFSKNLFYSCVKRVY